MTHLPHASTDELTTKGGKPFAKKFSENSNTMRLILNPVTLASIVGFIFGFLTVMALLPGHPRDSIEIRKTEYGDRWPFAIQQGRLRCEGAGAVILTVQGKDYAVNGMASTRYASMQPVWKSTNDPGDVGRIISRGLTLCKW
jgi:Protein of unknown function (DUF2511)